MKDWAIVAVSVVVLILVTVEVVKISQLPVMEVDVETQACFGMRFAPDYELVSCVNIPEKYDVVFVHRKTCE
ncbi:MAG: hypothetical protein KAH01_02505 [Caldisericia bacterium]|nr:hypothetical protein [Caldisericia bacterium]